MNSISCLLILVAVLSIDAEAQFLGYPQYPAFNQFPQYFRSGQIGASPNNAAVAGDVESRFFLNGALINAVLPRFTMTSTSTTTSVITSTCTTSTAALTACSPAGRRRRGLVVNGKQARGLFYADEELDEAEKASIFLPSK